jgi:hypothetical protein
MARMKPRKIKPPVSFIYLSSRKELGLAERLREKRSIRVRMTERRRKGCRDPDFLDFSATSAKGFS